LVLEVLQVVGSIQKGMLVVPSEVVIRKSAQLLCILLAEIIVAVLSVAMT
jgi:hypothetical protein